MSAGQIPEDPTLKGGGEMGATMRALDWSRTALGPPRSWPPRLRTAVDASLHSRFPVLVLWGPELLMLYNDGYQPVLGAKHPAAMGAPARTVWSELWETVGPMLHGVLETGAPTWSENLRLELERYGFREEAYFTFSCSPIHGEGDEVDGVLAILYETTAQVLGERRLQVLQRLAVEALGAVDPKAVCRRSAETLARDAADMPFALIYLLDADGKQARLEASSGLAPGDLHAPEVIALDGDGEEGWPLVRALREGEPVEVDDVAARFGRAPELPGFPPIVRAQVLPLTGASDQRAAGVLIVGLSPRLLRDERYLGFLAPMAQQVASALASARSSAEERNRTELLRELDRARTTFFSNVSHELRTPLTLLLGPLQELLNGTGEGTPAASREVLALAHRNALRLMKLVNSLLDFSRLEAGRAEARFQATALDALTVDLAESFRAAIEKAGLQLVLDAPPLSAPVFVDRAMFEKILLNLLSNALKFTFSGWIGVVLREGPERVTLQVRDTGAGIPAADLPRVFDRFHQVHGTHARSQEGSGIGLALVQEMARLHHGEVSVASREGVGSAFTVAFPRGSAHLPPEQVSPDAPLDLGDEVGAAYVSEALAWLPQESEESAAEGPPPSADTARSRILLVEDSADMRGYIRRLLARHWTVEVASDGRAALEAARQRPPDLVLTDVMMPGLDGFQLLQSLRDDPLTAAVPVILLSARAGEEATIEGLRAGADDYLSKPFSARELVSRVAARLEIARARDQAAKALARLHAHLMQAPVPVAILTGRELVYELANPAFLEMVSRPKLVGMRFREVFPEIPRDSEIYRVFWRVLDTGQPFTEEDNPVEIDLRGTGVPETRHFKYTVQPIRDFAGEVTAMMVVSIDITDQVLARQAVERSREEISRLAESERVARTRAEEADQRKDEFLAVLAHELRNPLAALRAAHALRDRLDHAAGAAPATLRLEETCNRQVGNLVRLVDDLLDISRVTMGRVQLRKERIDLTAVIHGAMQAVRALMEERRHTFQCSVAPGQYELDADPTRLEQVVSNLLVNAAKYTPDGGEISVWITREAREDRPWARIRVRDTGVGIAPDLLPRIFDLFVQADRSLDRSHGGLGIGLSLVRGLVTMHGGTVEARSEGTGKGTELTVLLPLLTAEEVVARSPTPGPRAAAAREKPRAPAREEPVPPRRVLIVEDTEDVREMLRELLELEGHHVDVAVDGLSGVERVLSLQPDLALIDVGLPGVDGYELARRVRAAPEGKGLFLVALTGYGGPEASRRAQSAGFDRHLVKPFDLRLLPELFAATRH